MNFNNLTPDEIQNLLSYRQQTGKINAPSVSTPQQGKKKVKKQQKQSKMSDFRLALYIVAALIVFFSVQTIYNFFMLPSPIKRDTPTARTTSAARLPPPSTINPPSFHRK